MIELRVDDLPDTRELPRFERLNIILALYHKPGDYEVTYEKCDPLSSEEPKPYKLYNMSADNRPSIYRFATLIELEDLVRELAG